jgi:hypothetical protein
VDENKVNKSKKRRPSQNKLGRSENVRDLSSTDNPAQTKGEGKTYRYSGGYVL